MTLARGLIGHTGFVGGSLVRQMDFSDLFNSRNIETIRDCEFDLLVCAGAPATMWAANRDPEGDARNLKGLSDAIRSTRTQRLVLISSVAVFDRMDAGYNETEAAYETAKAYGRNRRQLEVDVADVAEHVHIIRLPALFGPSLKKNFIYDLMNPVPSFVTPVKRDELFGQFAPSEKELFERYFDFDPDLGMIKFDRAAAISTGDIEALEAAHRRVGFEASAFTNAASQYQFYNVARLGKDIATCIAQDIACLNICSEPVTARVVHKTLLGRDFDNDAPAIVKEDVRTVHAAEFGRSGPYLFSREEVMADLLDYAGVRA